MDHSALRHQAEDTVGIVIYPVKAGSEIAVKDIVTEEISCLTVREDIPIFHKIALSGMVEGQDVVEYGQVIGRATEDIPVGGYVLAQFLNEPFQSVRVIPFQLRILGFGEE